MAKSSLDFPQKQYKHIESYLMDRLLKQYLVYGNLVYNRVKVKYK